MGELPFQVPAQLLRQGGQTGALAPAVLLVEEAAQGAAGGAALGGEGLVGQADGAAVAAHGLPGLKGGPAEGGQAAGAVLGVQIGPHAPAQVGPDHRVLVLEEGIAAEAEAALRGQDAPGVLGEGAEVPEEGDGHPAQGEELQEGGAAPHQAQDLGVVHHLGGGEHHPGRAVEEGDQLHLGLPGAEAPDGVEGAGGVGAQVVARRALVPQGTEGGVRRRGGGGREEAGARLHLLGQPEPHGALPGQGPEPLPLLRPGGGPVGCRPQQVDIVLGQVAHLVQKVAEGDLARRPGGGLQPGPLRVEPVDEAAALLRGLPAGEEGAGDVLQVVRPLPAVGAPPAPDRR